MDGDDLMVLSDAYSDEEDLRQEDDLIDDPDLNFGDIKTDKDKKSDHAVEFTVLTSAEMHVIQEQQISQIASILGLSKLASQIILRHFSWNRDKLLECYMEDPDRVIQTSGAIVEHLVPPRFETSTKESPTLNCFICCEDSKTEPMAKLLCEATICRSCYQRYLVQRIAGEGEVRRIACPGNCKAVVDDRTLELNLPTQVFQK